MPAYDELNANVAPTKSVFDQQQLRRPAAYRHCGRASAAIGGVCLLAEIGVFILKRGLTTMGIGIWTGATSVMLGAVTMAVPKTTTVCSVNTCFICCLLSMAVSVAGIMCCIVHIMFINAVVESEATPRPNFELTCVGCAYLLMLKEACQIATLLLQLAVSAILACFAYGDCLCCGDTETEVIMAPMKSDTEAAMAPMKTELVVTENQNASPSPSLSLRQSQSLVRQSSLHQPMQQAACSSSAITAPPSVSSVHRNLNTAPMLYDL